MVKCTKNIFNVVDIFYAYLFVCTHNVHYVLLFFYGAYCVVVFSLGAFLVVWLCLLGVLMDINQGSRKDKEDKRRSC